MRISDWSSDVCSSDLLTDMAGQCGSRRSGKDRWGIEDHNPSGMRRRKAVQHRLSPGRGEIFRVLVGWSARREHRSEEHTSELQSLMRISYAVFCLQKKTNNTRPTHTKSKPPRANTYTQ